MFSHAQIGPKGDQKQQSKINVGGQLSIVNYDFFKNTPHVFVQLYALKGEFWFISQDLSAEDGHIRSYSEGEMFVPQQGWQYLETGCTTVR